MDVQHCGSQILISAAGQPDESAGEVLQRALDNVPSAQRDLLVDLHAVTAMDVGGLLHLLYLHRRAEQLCLRVLISGWQAQPQQCMATVPASPGPEPLGSRGALRGRGELHVGVAAARREMPGCSGHSPFRSRTWLRIFAVAITVHPFRPEGVPIAMPCPVSRPQHGSGMLGGDTHTDREPGHPAAGAFGTF